MKRLKRVGIAALVLVALLAHSQQQALAALVNVPIDMRTVADGVYTGTSKAGMVSVEVEVKVQQQAITDICLLRHDNGRGKPAEAMLAQMVAHNTDDVDTVAGATASSLTIRNAVNGALRQGVAP